MSDDDDTGSSPFEHHAAFDKGEPDEESTSTISDEPPPIYYAFPREEEPEPEPTPPKPKAAEPEPWSIPWPVTIAMVAAAVIVVALVAAIVVIVTTREQPSGPLTAAPTTPSSVAPSTVAAPPPVTVTSEETITSTLTTQLYAPPSPTYPTYDPESAGLRQLQQIANTDHDVVLNGATNPDKWVPQLGSKKFGTTDHETFYDYPRIVQDFYQIKRSYPSAKLLRSGDWTTFNESDYWVTIAGVISSTADGALSWCRSNGLDNNHCYAKLISTTQGVEGSTAYQ